MFGLGVLVCLAAGRAAAQSDIPGGKDHPLLSRYPGSTIIDHRRVNVGLAVVQLEVSEVTSMDAGLVAVDASAMKKAIVETGRVALYGLFFDTGKAEVKPESKPTLDEIAKLLKAEPTLRVLVVGHTDTVGSQQSNQELSLRRAQSVADAVVKGHGIDPKRLQAAGVGFASPVATNRNEQGRAENPRVELVEY
jgi:outer membrane protein OmpA-like peptidoglycan-associated protein